jgi:hypothetical protein
MTLLRGNFSADAVCAHPLRWLIGHAKQQQNKQARSREEVKSKEEVLYEDETGLKINPLFTQLWPQFTMFYGIVSVWLGSTQITTNF